MEKKSTVTRHVHTKQCSNPLQTERPIKKARSCISECQHEDSSRKLVGVSKGISQFAWTKIVERFTANVSDSQRHSDATCDQTKNDPACHQASESGIPRQNIARFKPDLRSNGRPAASKHRRSFSDTTQHISAYKRKACGFSSSSHARSAGGILRQWEYVGQGHTSSSSHSLIFTVMTYNVLAQDLIVDNHYLYTQCPPEVLQWSTRSDRIYEEIALNSPDIICLQEVQKNHYWEFFKPKLEKLGFSGEYKKRTGDKTDGCATFVRTAKFRVHASVPIEYRRGDILDRDNVALVFQVSPKSPSLQHHQLIIANTHLLFNPRRGDVKLAQLCILLAELNKLTDSCATKPLVIICGDFNSEPFSDLYRFVVNGRFYYENVEIACISGQQQARMGSTARFLPKNFPPQLLGISGKCRYKSGAASNDLNGAGMNDPNGAGRNDPNGAGRNDPNGAGRNDPNGAGRNDPGRNDPDGAGRNDPASNDPDGAIQHSLNLTSAYNHHTARLSHSNADVTTQLGHTSCAVDYVFYSRDARLTLLARYGLLSRSELSQFNGLPNEYFPSDHLCLIVKFSLDL